MDADRFDEIFETVAQTLTEPLPSDAGLGSGAG
jgi:hypothetical protein